MEVELHGNYMQTVENVVERKDEHNRKLLKILPGNLERMF